MNPFRKKQVRRAILETLDMAKGYALENNTLRGHVDDLLRPPMSHDEWTDSLLFFTVEEHIRSVSNDADPTLKQWTITERGRTLLNSL